MLHHNGRGTQSQDLTDRDRYRIVAFLMDVLRIPNLLDAGKYDFIDLLQNGAWSLFSTEILFQAPFCLVCQHTRIRVSIVFDDN